MHAKVSLYTMQCASFSFVLVLQRIIAAAVDFSVDFRKHVWNSTERMGRCILFFTTDRLSCH